MSCDPPLFVQNKSTFLGRLFSVSDLRVTYLFL